MSLITVPACPRIPPFSFSATSAFISAFGGCGEFIMQMLQHNVNYPNLFTANGFSGEPCHDAASRLLSLLFVNIQLQVLKFSFTKHQGSFAGDTLMRRLE